MAGTWPHAPLRAQVLHACTAFTLMHGGVSRLLSTLLEGRHFSLSGRAECAPPPASTPTTAIAFARGCASPLVDDVSEQYAKDVERAYALSGVGLISLEELLCIAHEMAAHPRLAVDLATHGVLRPLQDVASQVYARHAAAVAFLAALTLPTQPLQSQQLAATPGSLRWPASPGHGAGAVTLDASNTFMEEQGSPGLCMTPGGSKLAPGMRAEAVLISPVAAMAALAARPGLKGTILGISGSATTPTAALTTIGAPRGVQAEVCVRDAVFSLFTTLV